MGNNLSPVATAPRFRLTIDVGLKMDGTGGAHMARLLHWQQLGRLDLVEAQPPRKPAVPDPTPSPLNSFSPARRRLSPLPSSGEVTFKSLAGILFPHRDPTKLRMSDINDVILLIRHHATKNDIFVTSNRATYLDDGHQERLRRAYGIQVMTPEEAVDLLSSKLA